MATGSYRRQHIARGVIQVSRIGRRCVNSSTAGSGRHDGHENAAEAPRFFIERQPTLTLGLTPRVHPIFSEISFRRMSVRSLLTSTNADHSYWCELSQMFSGSAPRIEGCATIERLIFTAPCSPLDGIHFRIKVGVDLHSHAIHVIVGLGTAEYLKLRSSRWVIKVC
jgi:hypothetical protein